MKNSQRFLNLNKSLFFFLVWATFFLTRLFLIFFFTPIASDIKVYFYNYATKMIYSSSRESFFSSVDFEYPPLFATVIYTPLLVIAFLKNLNLFVVKDIDQLYAIYTTVFRLIMFVFDFLIFAFIPKILKIIKSDNDEFSTLMSQLLYLVISVILSHLIFDRFDIIVGATVFIGLYFVLKSSELNEKIYSFIGYFLFGVSVAVKITPIFVLPVLTILDNKDNLNKKEYLTFVKNSFLRLFYVFVGASFGIIPYYIRYGSSIFKFLTYHSARGVQIESFYGAIYYIFSLFGFESKIYYEYGSWNISAPFHKIIASISTFFIVFFLSIFFVYLIFKIIKKGLVSGKKLFTYALALSFLVFMFFSKVFSPQYLFWLLPLLVVSPFLMEENKYIFIALLVFVSFFTYLIFPHFFFSDIVKLTLFGKILIIIRNSLLIFLSYFIFKNIKKEFIK